MDYLKRVKEEFTRQADTFNEYAAKADESVEDRFRGAVGEAGAGVILDVACGPGVVTAALAGRATSVTAFDATPAMLEKARKRCAEAGLDNVRFEQGDAQSMPFADGTFDVAVTRLAIHHFADPKRVIGEIFRVLRPGGTLVIADVIVSEDVGEAQLQNAIEIIRDPSHIRMLSGSELDSVVSEGGFEIASETTWEKSREFEEWMGIANDPQRVGPLRTIVHALAEDGRTAGMGLALAGDKVVFFHRWRMIVARRPEA